MKTLYKKGETCTADNDQVQLMKDGGWSDKKPADKPAANKPADKPVPAVKAK